MMLWTFPLVCCMSIPFFQYWDFCDSRLYYECLRNRILLDFREKRFFFAPINMFLFLYLIIALQALMFNAADNWGTWRGIVVAISPAIMPIVSFGITIFMNWDLRFFLITLANFTTHNHMWAQQHIGECVFVPETQLREVYRKMILKGRLPKGEPPHETFGKLCAQTKRKLNDGKGKLEHVQLDESIAELSSEAFKKVLSLLFGIPGFWMTDLLWLPGGRRARLFRAVFYLFNFVILIIECGLLTFVILTVREYLYIQGHIEDSSLFGMSLKHLMIDHDRL